MRAIFVSVCCEGKENRLRVTAACVLLIVLMFCGFEKEQLQKALWGNQQNAFHRVRTSGMIVQKPLWMFFILLIHIFITNIKV